MPLLLRLLVLLVATTSPGLAATSVYYSASDDGLSGSNVVPSGGLRSIYLYIDGGSAASAAGEACHVGQGDEVCGYDLELTGVDGLTFSAFNADAGADLLVSFDTGKVVINGLDSQSPSPGPHRIGELIVNAVEDGTVQLTKGEVVGADLESEILSAATLVTVPEPGGSDLLGSGAVLLALLRRRMRRS
jgi:hypothetical protein